MGVELIFMEFLQILRYKLQKNQKSNQFYSITIQFLTKKSQYLLFIFDFTRIHKIVPFCNTLDFGSRVKFWWPKLSTPFNI